MATPARALAAGAGGLGGRMMTCGVVTLLTDFGTHDPFVGVMKGVILKRSTRLTIIDVSHAIEAQQVGDGAFWLAQAFPWFPEGTVHVAVVDPGVGTLRRAVVGRAAGHLFVAPDNGLLEVVARRASGFEAREIEAAPFTGVTCSLPWAHCSRAARSRSTPWAHPARSRRRITFRSRCWAERAPRGASSSSIVSGISSRTSRPPRFRPAVRAESAFWATIWRWLARSPTCRPVRSRR